MIRGGKIEEGERERKNKRWILVRGLCSELRNTVWQNAASSFISLRPQRFGLAPVRKSCQKKEKRRKKKCGASSSCSAINNCTCQQHIPYNWQKSNVIAISILITTIYWGKHTNQLATVHSVASVPLGLTFLHKVGLIRQKYTTGHPLNSHFSQLRICLVTLSKQVRNEGKLT